jgi:hypothetical protein
VKKTTPIQQAASLLGKRGNRAMLRKVAEDHCLDISEVRIWIGKQNKKRKGKSRGGRPPVYPPCTFRFKRSGKLRGCHRFKNGVCACGVRQKTESA